MASPETFQLSVVTPERAVLECAARFVAFPAHDGEMGIMRGRAPLLCRLGIGPLRVDSEELGVQVILIDGGFAQMVENRLTILTQQCWRPAELDRGAAERALAEARKLAVRDERSFSERQNALQRARAQRKLAL